MDINRFLKLRFLDKGKGWYLVPRAQYFNERNIEELHTVLVLMKRQQYVKVGNLKVYQTSLGEQFSPDKLVYREWSQDIQMDIFNEMIKLGIIKPHTRGQSKNDQLANLRNHFNLIRKLGFGFINKQKHLFISDVGEDFLKSGKSMWRELLEKQLIKLQFWNPSIITKELEKYKEFNLFPFVFVIELILSLKDPYVDVYEFMLFVSHAKTMVDKETIKNLIEAYRKLSKDEQLAIRQRANFSEPESANASVTLGLFGSTPTFSFQNNKLDFKDIERGEDLVEKYANKLRFIEYECFEDWYQYAGSKDTEVSIAEGLQYYGELGEEEKAKKFLETYVEVPEQELEEGVTFEEKLRRLISEKLLEDYLEQNVNLIEVGLKLVRNGRQYATEIGRIDLLAVDSQGRYVVIELKKDKLEDKVMGQTLRYMGWVKGNLAKTGEVRGIIIGQIISEKLKYAKEGLQYSSNLVGLMPINVNVTGNIHLEKAI